VNEYASGKGCGFESEEKGEVGACRPIFCWGYKDFSVLLSVLSFKGNTGRKRQKRQQRKTELIDSKSIVK
jgi:hypothetical protein